MMYAVPRDAMVADEARILPADRQALFAEAGGRRRGRRRDHAGGNLDDLRRQPVHRVGFRALLRRGCRQIEPGQRLRIRLPRASLLAREQCLPVRQLGVISEIGMARDLRRHLARVLRGGGRLHGFGQNPVQLAPAAVGQMFANHLFDDPVRTAIGAVSRHDQSAFRQRIAEEAAYRREMPCT